MSSRIKNKVKTKKAILGGIVDKSVGSYEKHPFFVKKANEAKALIKKLVYPKN